MPHVVLCCVVLCCAVLCCAVLCCAVLCCAVLGCAVLCCAVWGLQLDTRTDLLGAFAPGGATCARNAALPRGAAKRLQHQRKIDAINAGAASIEEFTRHRAPVVAPNRRTVSRGGPEAGARASRSRSAAAPSRPDPRDAQLAALRAELNSLRAQQR